MWIQLTADTLLSRVTGIEASKLNTVALKQGQADVLEEIAGQVAKEWRGGLRRYTTLDTRAGYVPDELLIHMLADLRYRAYTRIPGMADLLDDLRVKEWDRANQVRDNLNKVSIEPADAEHAESTEVSGQPVPLFTEPESVLEAE